MEKQNNQIVELPKINSTDIIESTEVQSIISQNLEKSSEQGEKLQTFLKEGLDSLFTSQAQTNEQVQKIFDTIVDKEYLQQQAKDIINTYIEHNDPTVHNAIKNMEEELSNLNPMVKTIRDTLEGGAGIFSKFKNMFKEDMDVIKSSTEGIVGRITSLENIFESAGRTLQVDQKNLKRIIPEIGYRIAMIDGMQKALEIIINKGILDNKATGIVKKLNEELLSMSGIQKESLHRLLVLSEMNGSSVLILTSVETELLVSLQPLLLENFVSANALGVSKMKDIIRDGMRGLREQSKKNIIKIQEMELEDKEGLNDRLGEITSNVEWLLDKTSQHEENMSRVQEKIDQSLPAFKKAIAKAEQGIYDQVNKNDTFSEESKLIIGEVKELGNELQGYMNNKKTKTLDAEVVK